MKLGQIKCNNIFQFKNISVDFPDNGVSLVRGLVGGNENNSNGAGKSNLFEAVNLCLFGKTLKGVPRSEIVRRGAKGGKIQLSIGDLGITRRFPDHVLSLTINGVDVPITRIADGEEIIRQSLGLDWDAWINTVMHGQDIVSSFVQSQPKARRDLIGRLLDFEKLDRCVDYCRGRLLANEDSVYHFDRNIFHYNEAIERLSDELRGLGVSRHVDKIDVDVAESRKQLKLASAEIDRSEERDISGQLNECLIQKAHLDRSEDIELREKAVRYEELLEQDDCPECERPLDGKFRETLESNAKWFMEEYKESESVRKSKLSKLGVKIEQKQKKLDKVCEKLDKKSQLMHIRRGKLQAKLEKLAAERELSVGYEEKVQSMNNYRRLLSKVTKKHEKVQKRVVQWGELMRFFGQGGIRTDILADFIPYLEFKVNGYLSELTNGGFSLRIDPNKMSFVISKGKSKFGWHSYSGGEKRLIAVILDLALGEVLIEESKVVEMLVLDEPLAQVDSDKALRVMELLESIADEKQIAIYLITNELRVINMVPDLTHIVVRSSGGVSSVEVEEVSNV